MPASGSDMAIATIISPRQTAGMTCRAAVTDLTDEQGHKRPNTLEQLLDVFVRTLSVSPDEVVARHTPPTTPEERTAFSLSVARSHIARAQTALACGDAGRAVESSVIAASYTASILDRRAQQRMLSSFGGKQTPYAKLKLKAIGRATRIWKSDPDRSASSIAAELYRQFDAEERPVLPSERTIRRWLRSRKTQVKQVLPNKLAGSKFLPSVCLFLLWLATSCYPLQGGRHALDRCRRRTRPTQSVKRDE